LEQESAAFQLTTGLHLTPVSSRLFHNDSRHFGRSIHAAPLIRDTRGSNHAIPFEIRFRHLSRKLGLVCFGRVCVAVRRSAINRARRWSLVYSWRDCSCVGCALANSAI